MALARRSAKTAQKSPAKKAAKPAPVAAPKTTPKLSQPASRTADDVRKAWAEARAAGGGGGGSKTPFLKLTSGKNAIRILPRADSPVPFYQAYIHTYRKQGRGYDAVDLRFVFSDAARAERAMELGKVTKADFQKFQKYGDPFNVASEKVKALGLPKTVTPILWATLKFYLNVVNRASEGVFLWTIGKKTMEQLEAFVANEDDPNGPPQIELLVDPKEGFDVLLAGNGEDNIKRRYTYSLARKPSPVEYDPAQLLDLEKIVLSRVIGFDAKVNALFDSYPELMEKAGMSKSDFGLQGSPGAGESEGEDDEEDDD
jgi:hypothetical protein